MTPSRVAELLENNTRIVIFHRAEGHYALECAFESDWTKVATSNPGTLKITDALTDKVLWCVG